MSRAPVTVAIPACNAWEATRSCLDALRQTLAPRDRVIVVDNGSTDATAAALRLYPWVEVLRLPANQGFGAAANAALAASRDDVVILLHSDTVPAHRWIEPLVAALSDPAVAAAGPLSNWSTGPQMVVAPPYTLISDMRRFARDWCAAHRDEQIEATELDSFCLALRRSAVDAAGGFDEGYGPGSFETRDLVLRLRQDGHRLVVARDSFVHHEGLQSYIANGIDWLVERGAHRDRFAEAHPDATGGPFVSGCIITKDEEANLPACLESLARFADEIVVYDTGSTDGTVELARSLGAKVVEGYWDDDFSRARNAALAECSGDWIAWLDADETLETGGDPTELLEVLARTRPDIDAWSVRIRNLTGSGTGSEFQHYASRLFRRARCEWTGRLHEQIATRDQHGPIRQAELAAGWINHTGYLDQVMAERKKAERNLRVAQTEVDRADGWDRGYSLSSLGRSLVLAGRYEEGLQSLTESFDHTSNGITRRLSARGAIDATLALGRLDDALDWCRRLAREGADPRSVDIMEAPIRIAGREFDLAYELLSRVEPGVNDSDGFSVSLGAYTAQKAQALAGLGRYAEASDTMLSALAEEGVLDAHLGALVEYTLQADRDLSAVAQAIPADRVNLFLAQVLQLQPEIGDQVLEAGLNAPGLDQRALLATASKLALRLPLERTLVWSARLREAGYASACPLIALASSSEAPAVLRARAAAIAVGAFGDDRGAPLFSEAVAASVGEERAQIEAEAAQLCPQLLPPAGAAAAAAASL